MNRLTKLSVCGMVFALITGCSWLWGDRGYVRDRSSDYLKSHQTPPIKIPEDLQANTQPLDTLYPIPNHIPNPTHSKFEAPKPVALQAADNVNIPSLQNVNGVQWLLVQQTTAVTYQQVLQYFQQARFHIDTQHSYAGEFTTSWVKPTNLADMLLARLLAVDSSLNTQEIKLRVRVEPSVQSNTSEVYILNIVRPEGSTANVDWPTKSQNALVESVLLDELAANMGNVQNADVSVSLLADENISNVSKASLIRDAQGIPVLAFASTFDIVWAQVEHAINTANIRIDDIDRSSGLYYINLAEKADGTAQNSSIFGTDSQADIEARAERYIITVKQIASMVHVSVVDVNSVPVTVTTAEAILKQIQQNIN